MAERKINIVIPMAGAGSRFAKVGYVSPKPLIPVFGKPMIEIVIENVRVQNAHFIFIVQKDHRERHNLDELLRVMTAPDECDIIETSRLTEGAACSVLLAEHLIGG
jgi:dTDP-glucose pyrophosphorylase